MYIVVGYDTPDDKRRLRMAKILLDYGYRVQKSVFEIEAPPKLIDEMIERLKKTVDPQEDSVRIYHICTKCIESADFLGNATLTNTEEVFVL